MKALVTVVRGAASAKHFTLDGTQPVRIGRGSGCQILLSDPLSSRTHAVVCVEDGQWIVSDVESQNGTFVNKKRISQYRLSDGDRIQIGSTEILFKLAGDDSDTEPSGSVLVLEADISAEASGQSLNQMVNQQRSQDLLDLYQLSIHLMKCTSPDEVAELGLEMLRVRTRATVVGILWVDENGNLKPHLILPAELADRLRLNRKLTERVSQDGRGIWVKDEIPGRGEKTGFADGICIPLKRNEVVTGAVHIYREEGSFEQADFDFAISAGNMISAALENALSRASLSAEHQRLVQRTAEFYELIGQSPEMERLKDRIARVAKANGCVLVRGESGVGKELVSRAIHRLSPRKNRPMLCVNCAAIPGELMESQLFGHKKGAFTGADKDHNGWFQQAHTGTLFLDEVGELTLDGQAKLLRILEGHPFMPVGDTKEVMVDVRVIAATNRDLREYVREKRFREDLYYRLSVFELVVPPLRQRGKDIEILIQHFLTHFRKTHGRQSLQLSDKALERLMAYQWPGNIRQLRNVIDSAVVLASGNVIQPSDLSLHDAGVDQLETLRLDQWEERLIREALARTENNINEATKLLGVSRATLYRKLEQYSIQR